MALYSAGFSNLALSTTNDARTFQTTATGQGSFIRLYEIFMGGEAGSTAVARVAVNRPSAAPTGAPTSQAPEKLNPASVAAASTVATTYATTQPTLSANDILTPTFNAFGGIIRWVAPPDSQIVVGVQGAIAYLSIRSRSGTPTVSGHVLFEEL